MFSALRKDYSQRESFTIASPHTIYHHCSDSLAENQEIRNLMFKVVRSPNNLRQSLIGVGNRDTVLRTLERYNLSSSELREVEAFFHLSLKDLCNPFTERAINADEYRNLFSYGYQEDFAEELNKFLRQNVQPVEKVILASLFLENNQILEEFQYIHDLMHGNMYHICEPFDHIELIDKELRTRLIPSKHGKIPLSGSLIKEKVSFLIKKKPPRIDLLNIESSKIDSVTVEDLRINPNPSTKSYYHINKNELMERVRHLLCERLFNGERPRDMEEIEELYDRLLNYKGTTMGRTASNQFPDDEITFIGNRSIIGESLEEAGNLDPVLLRVDDSIPNFKVTHHRVIRDREELIPIIDVEVGTNNQLRDALGYDGMFDRNLTLEDSWMNVKRETDLHRVREMLVDMISASSSGVTMILKENETYREFTIKANNGSIIIQGGLGDLRIKTSSQTLCLEQLDPEEMSFPLRYNRVNHGVNDPYLISSSNEQDALTARRIDDDEKELVREEVNEQQESQYGQYGLIGNPLIYRRFHHIVDDNPHEFPFDSHTPFFVQENDFNVPVEDDVHDPAHYLTPAKDNDSLETMFNEEEVEAGTENGDVASFF